MNKAVALRFEPEINESPKIVAKGTDELAFRIVNAAKSKEIPVVFEPNLVYLLERLETGTEIPDNLYRAVAELFVYLMQSGQLRQDRFNRGKADEINEDDSRSRNQARHGIRQRRLH